MVMVDPWSIGCFEDGDRRLARGLAWLRSDLEGDNAYSRPIGGLVGVVDLNTMEVVRIDDHGVLPVPSGEGGDYRPGALAPPRTDVRAVRDHPARRAELHPRRPRAGVAGLDARRRLLAARGARAAPDRLRRPAGVPPRVDRRARDSLRRSQPDRPLQERVRHRRVRPRPARERARAGLRLPRRDQLPRRVGQRLARRRPRASERDLHPRGGHRDPLEALRLPLRPHRRGPRAAARRLVHRDRRELRVRLLLVPGPGRHDRLRGQADRRPAHGRRARGRARPARDRDRAGRRRERPPALLLRPARHGRRRDEEHGRRDRRALRAALAA